MQYNITNWSKVLKWRCFLSEKDSTWSESQASEFQITNRVDAVGGQEGRDQSLSFPLLILIILCIIQGIQQLPEIMWNKRVFRSCSSEDTQRCGWGKGRRIQGFVGPARRDSEVSVRQNYWAKLSIINQPTLWFSHSTSTRESTRATFLGTHLHWTSILSNRTNIR